MGRRGHVQTRQAEHDTEVCLSGWAQATAAGFLADRGIDVCTGDSSGMIDPADADHWEIAIPYVERPEGFVRDYERIEKAIAELRADPGLVKGEDGEGEYGDSLADLLESGLKAARKRDYDWIMVDFW